MTLKRTELEKRKGLAIGNALRQAGNPYGAAAATEADRKARREADRAAGLVPFAAKLPADLVRAPCCEGQGQGSTPHPALH